MLKCNYSEKSFRSREVPRNVCFKHTHDRPHKWPNCDCMTVALRKFNMHMTCHGGEKRYQCDHCDKSFILKQLLKRHASNSWSGTQDIGQPKYCQLVLYSPQSTGPECLHTAAQPCRHLLLPEPLTACSYLSKRTAKSGTPGDKTEQLQPNLKLPWFFKPLVAENITFQTFNLKIISTPGGNNRKRYLADNLTPN